MKFRVTVKEGSGAESTQVLEAADRFSVYADVEKAGGTVVALEETTEGAAPRFTISFGSGIKIEERITFTKNLSAMLSAGLSLSRALSVIERQSVNAALKKVVVDLSEKVKAGSSFHEALAEHENIFSKLFIAMTKAGEESGTLSDSLKIVAKQMDRSYALSRKIKGAMTYPAIIVTAVIIIGVLMLVYVVPTLSATFSSLGAQLPLATKVIIGMSNFMAHNVIVTFLILFAFFGGIIAFIRSKFGSKLVLQAALHLPVIGELTRETFSARAARTLSSLLSSGVDMLVALQITAEVVGENIFGEILTEAEVRVRKGEPLSAAFIEHSKLFPVFVGDMIAVGEETGTVGDMLSQVAEYYETDVEERTKDLSSIIEPILMLFIGVFVGIFALAMIAPIYSLSSKI